MNKIKAIKKYTEMKEKQRIYGEDKGNLTPETLEKIDQLLKEDPKRAELFIYFLFDECDLFCWRYNHLKPSGYEIPHTAETQKDYENVNYARFYLIGLTKNFGVTFEPRDEMKVNMSESFNKWYNFWKNFIQGMSEEKWQNFSKAFSNDEDISEYLPRNTWNDEV
jgi:hypothetical protein